MTMANGYLDTVALTQIANLSPDFDVIYADVIPGGTDLARWQAAIDLASARGGGRIVATNRDYSFVGTLNVTTDYIILDFTAAKSVTFDPTTSGANGSPAIFARGSLSGVSAAFSNVLVGNNQITATGNGSNFSAGSDVLVQDQATTLGWDNGLSGAVSGPYVGRSEINSITSVATDLITLEKPVEWSYDTTPTIQRVNLLKGFKVVGIKNATEVDPGAIFTGDVNIPSTTPFIVSCQFCLAPEVDGLEIDGFQLHTVNFRHCLHPVARRLRPRNAFRPTDGGHGYGVRFDRCEGGVAELCVSYKVRHLVDWTQSYRGCSRNNLARESVSASYETHGLGAKKIVSVDDVDVGSNTGWVVGNPSFNADYDCQIIRPKTVGTRVPVQHVARADGLLVKDPEFDGSISQDILIAGGATNIVVSGGVSVMGRNTAASIVARDKITTTDTSGVYPGNITIEGYDWKNAQGQSSQAAFLIDCTGDLIVKNNILRLDAAVSTAILLNTNQAATTVIVEGNRGRGAGSGRFARVVLAPSGVYRFQNNTDRGAARGVRITKGTKLRVTDNDLGTGVWTADGSSTPEVNRDNVPAFV